MSALDLAGNRLDWAVAGCFGPAALGHLLVSISSNKVVMLDALSGCTVRELPNVCPMAFSSLALSEDAHFLLTATSRVIKVWNYWTQTDPSCQALAQGSWRVQLVGPTGSPSSRCPCHPRDPPPQLDVYAMPPEGSDCTFCMSGKESPGPPVLVESEADGAGDAAWGSVSRSQGLFVPPLHYSGPSTQSVQEARAQPPACPGSCKHVMARYKASTLAESVSFLPEGAEQLHLRTVVGYSGNWQANMVWKPDTGFFVYMCGHGSYSEALSTGLS